MKKILLSMLFLTMSAVAAPDNGLVSKASRHPVGETITRLEAILEAKGITIFARIDHAEEARKAGLTMRPAQLLIFGNPKAGTPIMQAVPQAGIDLPLKALAWEDANGKVWISYNDPRYLRERFGLSEEAIKPLMGVGALIDTGGK